MVSAEYLKTLILFIILLLGFFLNLMSNSLISAGLYDNHKYALYGTTIHTLLIIGAFLPVGIDLGIDFYIPLMRHFKKYSGIRRYHLLYFSILAKFLIASLLLITSSYLLLLVLDKSHIFHFQHKLLYIYEDLLYFPIGAVTISLTLYFSRMLRTYGHTIKSITLFQCAPYAILYLILWLFKFHSVKDFCIVYVFSWSLTAIISMVIYYRVDRSAFANANKEFFSQKNIVKLFNYEKFGISRTMKHSLFLLLGGSSDYIFGIFIIIFSCISSDKNEISYAVAIGTLNLFFFVILKTMSALMRPRIRLLYVSNIEQLKRYIKVLFPLSLGITIITLLVVIIFGKEILLHFFGKSYVNAYMPYCISAAGFVLVEGFIIRKQLIGQLLPLYNARITVLTNIITLMLMTVGACFSLAAATAGFVAGRIVWTVLAFRCKLEKIDN